MADTKRIIFIAALIFAIGAAFFQSKAYGASFYIVARPDGSASRLPVRNIGANDYASVKRIADAAFPKSRFSGYGEISRDDMKLNLIPGSFFVLYQKGDDLRMSQLNLPALETNGKSYAPIISFFRSLDSLGIYSVKIVGNKILLRNPKSGKPVPVEKPQTHYAEEDASKGVKIRVPVFPSAPADRVETSAEIDYDESSPETEYKADADADKNARTYEAVPVETSDVEDDENSGPESSTGVILIKDIRNFSPESLPSSRDENRYRKASESVPPKIHRAYDEEFDEDEREIPENYYSIPRDLKRTELKQIETNPYKPEKEKK